MNTTDNEIINSPFESKKSEEMNNLLTFINTNNIKEFRNSLIDLKNIDITKIKDQKNYTLLHISCLNNLEEFFFCIIDHIKKDEITKNINENEIRIKQYIDSITIEGYSAIHFASYKGNIVKKHKKIYYDANIFVINKFGLNVIHIAAQGDSPSSLYFFKNKGLELNKPDLKGSTALHWAAFRGCENAVNFLTSWNCDLNKKDEEGLYTPLHLAVISGSSRIVRRLLIKGANKHLLDKNFKKPIDLAKENDYMHIYSLLEDKNNIYEICNIKPKPKPMKKNILNISLFIFSYFPIHIAIYFLYFPYIDNLAFIVIYLFTIINTLLMFILAWLKNPGYLKNNKKILKKKSNFIDLLLKHDLSKICPDCEILKPPRSKHCEVCNSCVKVYDHHCPWINNCVGANNHKYFILFIFAILIDVIFCLIIVGINISIKTPIYTYVSQYDLPDSNLFYCKIILSIIIVLFACFFLIPLIFLFWVHVSNFLLNQTTSERYGYNVRPKISVDNENSRKTSESNGNIEEKNSLNNRSYYENNQNYKINYASNCQAMCCLNEKNDIYTFGNIPE